MVVDVSPTNLIKEFKMIEKVKVKCHCDFCQEIIYITENQDNVCNDCNEDLKNISKKRIVN